MTLREIRIELAKLALDLEKHELASDDNGSPNMSGFDVLLNRLENLLRDLRLVTTGRPGRS